ncbi:hypothetical protein NHX12_012799 [Xyrichtys novacula]|uniref:Endonuclease/exonuclease/phosphatase domain-containing protein n=1 Tax=Xyrichtys novacula TaxID=13765 RepID=A0AAV1FU43_XYRNO|nr:hypothetical protein NHX12_012799 [Xyrichtys novacula]
MSTPTTQETSQKKAMNKLKTGKSPGSDNIHPEFVIHQSTATSCWLCAFFTSCYGKLKLPKTWRSAFLIALPKPNRPAEDPKSYRPISMLCVPLKILERMTHSRNEPVVDSQHPNWFPTWKINRRPGATGAAAEAKLDATIPVALSHPSTPWDIPGPPTAPSVRPEADLHPNIPATQPPTRGAEVCWLQEGAKPKAPHGYFTPNPKLCNSTPGSWIPVKSNTRLKKKSPPRRCSVGILLSNSFSPLDEQDFHFRLGRQVRHDALLLCSLHRSGIQVSLGTLLHLRHQHPQQLRPRICASLREARGSLPSNQTQSSTSFGTRGQHLNVPFNSYSSFEYHAFAFSSPPIVCFNLYRPPCYSSSFISEFSKLLSIIHTTYNKILITGDFNLHIDNTSDPVSREFLNLLKCFDFQQHVTQLTHSRGAHAGPGHKLWPVR